MSPFTQTILLSAVLAAGAARAQMPTATPAAPATPAYRSAFEGYRPFEPGEVQDWRQSNDTVREIGGWRAYAREIQGGASPASARPAPASSAPGQARPADPHQGHHR